MPRSEFGAGARVMSLIGLRAGEGPLAEAVGAEEIDGGSADGDGDGP